MSSFASGRGAVPRVEAVERARAEGRELVDLLLLACACFCGRGARALGSRGPGASGALTVLVKRVAPLPARRRNPGPVDGRSDTVHDAGAHDETCAAPTSREAREASTAMTS